MPSITDPNETNEDKKPISVVLAPNESTEDEKPMSVVLAPNDGSINDSITNDHEDENENVKDADTAGTTDTDRNDMADMLDEIDTVSPDDHHEEDMDDARDDTNFDDDVSLFSSPLSRHKDIRTMLAVGRKAVKHADGIVQLKRNLAPYLHQLTDRAHSPEYKPNDAVQRVFLDEWVEELLRFLALKTITEDLTEPFQLYPGPWITLAWKIMMNLPLVYSKACTDMGNLQLFEFEKLPSSGLHNEIYQKHQRKRYNATLRAYSTHFEQQPPQLYWTLYPKKHSPAPYNKKEEKKEDDSVMNVIKQLLCMQPDTNVDDATTGKQSTVYEAEYDNEPLRTTKPKRHLSPSYEMY